MTISENLDEGMKKQNSLYFRCILIFYSLSIIVRYHNLFNLPIAFLSTTAYVFLFFLLRRKIKFFRVLRLLNDFIYINFIAFQVGHLSSDLVIFLMLPLINALNHTHESIRKSFSIQLYIFTIASFFITSHFQYDFYFLIPILTVSFVNLSIAFRMFLNKFNNELDNIIEDFYSKTDSIVKIYKILRKLIATINTNDFLKNFIKVDRISIFKIVKKQAPYIVISSDFIYSCELKYNATNTPKYLTRVEGTINGVSIKHGIALELKIEKEGSNLFLIEFQRKVQSHLLAILIEKVLSPVFTRLLRINTLELEIFNVKKKYFEKTKSEFENIDSAANAVHFLANKLTPVTNYFKMVNDLNNGKIPDKHVAEWHELINSDFVRATRNIKSIQAKMLQIASFTSNTEHYSDVENLKLKSFITYLRKTFIEDCFHPFSIKISEDHAEMLEKSIKVNETALDFVFIELIDNYNKHAEANITIEITVDNQKSILSVTLINEIKNYDEMKRLVGDYVKDFNTGEINSLLQRRGNKGIKFLKQFLCELGVEHTCENVNNLMFIFLKFKIS